MTPEQATTFNTSILNLYEVIRTLPIPGTVPDHELYEPLKQLHDAAIIPWSILVDILRSDISIMAQDSSRSNVPRSLPSVADFQV